MSDSSTNVQVVCRVRPFNEREDKGNTLPVLTASSEKKEVTLIRGAGNRQQRMTFNFDAVYGSFSSQRDVFQSVGVLVNDVVNGYEATVRACARLISECVRSIQA